MNNKKSYRIDTALDELVLVRHEIIGILEEIERKNNTVISKIGEIKEETINNHGFEGLDLALQLDDITKEINLTNTYINSLRS